MRVDLLVVRWFYTKKGGVGECGAVSLLFERLDF